MRALTAMVLSCVWFGSASAAEGAADKPKIRNLQVKSGYLSFQVMLRPGVPDPGQVVEIGLDVAEIPPVPDPIYGERIPVKDIDLVAAVTDSAGYTMTYRVHKLQDVGAYGFHFTPLRKDTYQVVLRGVYQEKKIDPEFSVLAGIWPPKEGEGQAAQPALATVPSSSRLPALPSGMAAPAVPTGMAKGSEVPGKVVSPLRGAMSRLGELWAEAGVALLVGRKPDLSQAASLAGELKTAVREAAVMRPSDEEFTGLMKELWQAVGAFEKSASSKKAKPSLEEFRRIGSRHCNRCHFKMRWGLLDNLAAFPDGLP